MFAKSSAFITTMPCCNSCCCSCCCRLGKACTRKGHWGYSQEARVTPPRGGANRCRTAPQRPHVGLTAADVCHPIPFPYNGTTAPNPVMLVMMSILPGQQPMLPQLLCLCLCLQLILQYHGEVKDLLCQDLLGRLCQDKRGKEKQNPAIKDTAGRVQFSIPWLPSAATWALRWVYLQAPTGGCASLCEHAYKIGG